MIGYVTLGTNDFDRAVSFYDTLLTEMGAQRFDTSDRFAYWGKKRGLGLLAVFKPYNEQPRDPRKQHPNENWPKNPNIASESW